MNIEKKSKFANNGTLSPEKKLRQKKHDLKKKYGLSTKKILEATKSKPELAQDIKNWDRKINSLNEILKKYEE